MEIKESSSLFVSEPPPVSDLLAKRRQGREIWRRSVVEPAVPGSAAYELTLIGPGSKETVDEPLSIPSALALQVSATR